MTEAPTIPAAAGGTLRLGGELTVNRMGFGAMRLCGEKIWGSPADPDMPGRVLNRALELGVEFIDTADAYGPEVNERQIAEALHPYPPELVIATKGGLVREGPDHWGRNGRPEHLRRACEASLRRLRVEAIDLYQLHAPDPRVPYEDSVGALADLQREGKIRLVGISNVGLDRLETALEIVNVISVQNRYSLADRASDAVVDRCESEGIAFLPWYPLAAGKLAGADSPLAEPAGRKRVTQAQLALAWLLHRSSTMLPIPGTTSVEHLEENVAAAAIELDETETAELAALAGGG